MANRLPTRNTSWVSIVHDAGTRVGVDSRKKEGSSAGHDTCSSDELSRSIDTERIVTVIRTVSRAAPFAPSANRTIRAKLLVGSGNWVMDTEPRPERTVVCTLTLPEGMIGVMLE